VILAVCVGVGLAGDAAVAADGVGEVGVRVGQRADHRGGGVAVREVGGIQQLPVMPADAFCEGVLAQLSEPGGVKDRVADGAGAFRLQVFDDGVLRARRLLEGAAGDPVAAAVAPAPFTVGLDALVRLHFNDQDALPRRHDHKVGFALHLADVPRDLERVKDDPVLCFLCVAEGGEDRVLARRGVVADRRRDHAGHEVRLLRAPLREGAGVDARAVCLPRHVPRKAHSLSGTCHPLAATRRMPPGGHQQPCARCEVGCRDERDASLTASV